MVWQRRAIKRQGANRQMKRLFLGLAMAGAILSASAPATAQLLKNDGEELLTALKEGENGKALDIVERPGSTTAVSYRGYDGNTPLHVVVRSRNSNWVGFLLSKGADPNVGDTNGDTPLILAARLGFSEGVARLLMKRALVEKGNRLGETALIVAVQQRQPGIVRMLLEAGANPDKPDHAAGYTARDYARRDNRSTEIMKLIEGVKAKKTATVGPVIR
jgi:uncharacterized protein